MEDVNVYGNDNEETNEAKVPEAPQEQGEESGE